MSKRKAESTNPRFYLEWKGFKGKSKLVQVKIAHKTLGKFTFDFYALNHKKFGESKLNLLPSFEKKDLGLTIKGVSLSNGSPLHGGTVWSNATKKKDLVHKLSGDIVYELVLSEDITSVEVVSSSVNVVPVESHKAPKFAEIDVLVSSLLARLK